MTGVLTVNTVLRLRDNIETKLRRTLCLVVIKVKHKFEAIIKYRFVHIYAACRMFVARAPQKLNPFTFKLCGNNEISKFRLCSEFYHTVKGLRKRSLFYFVHFNPGIIFS